MAPFNRQAPLLERDFARYGLVLPTKRNDPLWNTHDGAILRRITEKPITKAASKLATIILDGIAWKDGSNGLECETVAFTLTHLAEKMGFSRQCLTAQSAGLAVSGLYLVRWISNGTFAPWLFWYRDNSGAGIHRTHWAGLFTLFQRDRINMQGSRPSIG